MASTCVAVSFVMVLVLFTTEIAANDPCQFKIFEVQTCISEGNVDMNRVLDPSYKQTMCSEQQPARTCVSQHRQECPDISVFQGRQGRAVRKFLASFDRFCSAPGNGTSESRPSGGRCRGSERRLASRMARCNRPLEVNLRESQMCTPMQRMLSCVKRQLRRFSPCPWLTATVANQVRLGVDFLGAVRAIRYNCSS
ncbi:uncharacterized protein LOC143289118 [Babylonia areolata]|uniref:uncharacterized protein LOC143289118 n=1 Tax=Babylonia areolata TaxID=304850 RepID=UPI003FD2C5B6